MELKKELEKWVNDKTRYVTKSYLIKKQVDKRNIDLFYKYEKEDEVVERKAKVAVGYAEDFSPKELNRFLDYCSGIFHKAMADYIEAFWEQDIFTENPTNMDLFEMAYYSDLKEKDEEGERRSGRVIITDGTRKDDQIFSKDETINDDVKKDVIRLVGWSHK